MPPVDGRPPPTVMVDPNPPRPPRLVGGLLRNGQLPNNRVEALLGRFQVTREDGGSLPMEKRSGRGLHSFLYHLTSGVDPVPGFEWVALLQVE